MDAPSGHTVLVVDDDEDLLALLKYEYTLKGFRALTARCGDEAFRIAESQPVDGVITDIRMAGGDGLSLLRALKGNNARRPVVILISGYADVTPREILALGGEALFAKPFRLKDLVRATERLLKPTEQQWTTPPRHPPTRYVSRNVATPETLLNGKEIAVGRGGLALQVPGPAPYLGEHMGFLVTFEKEPARRFEGCGVVRWAFQTSQQAPLTAGIEFEFLTSETRALMSAWLTDHPIRPFIPSLVP
jgi:CheY-like chemotaxis protein